MNFEPAFSSESFNGRKRQTTLMLSTAAISLSAAIVCGAERLATGNRYENGDGRSEKKVQRRGGGV